MVCGEKKGMIDRYTTPAMSAIWNRDAKYKKWMEVELAICEAHFQFGDIPLDDIQKIRQRIGFDLLRCDEIEKETKHDLAAFVRNLEENVGESGRWIHFGVTSYDVIDTALGMMMRDSCDVLSNSLATLSQILEKLSREHSMTPMIGRTHAIHAEPITFGFKLSGWLAEIKRSQMRIENCKKEVSVGKVSGAVGIHAHVSLEKEEMICTSLGLAADPSSTQIVNRDRMANLFSVIAVLAGGLERIATELRNLQRTEILEVQEEFSAGQTGSSAMPHKRNPWNSETVCGLARVVRGNAHAMLETIATWHERDLTNSSLERIVLPDTFHLIDFMINRVSKILSGIIVMPENMKINLRKMGDLVFSEHLMVALIRSGLSRRDAYKIAQKHAANAWDGIDFKESVFGDSEVSSRLSPEELQEVFSLEHHLRNANLTVEKVIKG